MQQVSNILLGSSNKTASSSSDVLSQGADNNSFLSAFNQVTQSDVKKISLDKNDLSTKALTEDAQHAGVEETDVELIFAQIDLAENFETKTAVEADGNILPITAPIPDSGLLPDEETNAIEGEINASELFLSAVSTSETIDANKINPAVTDFLGSLSSEQFDKFSAFTSMNETELLSLSPTQLNKLISDFNKFNQLPIDSELPLITVSSALESNQSNNVKAANIASIEFNESGKVVDGLPQKQAAAVNILGTAENEEGKINSKDANINLAKAELSVLLEKSAVQDNSIAQNAAKTHSVLSATAANNALTASEINLDLDAIDLKAIQNQSSFTSPHKSDVPQFQLSLRQGSESAVQMQDMIQKFAPVMKQQLITMVSQGVQQAEIRLDPAELGHMVVRVQVNGDQTQVQFQVAQSQTRDLIEQAIPRLRDMLAEEGLQLADSHVSQDGEKQNKSEYDENNGTEESLLDDISAQELELTTKHAMSGNSAIDYYA